VGKAKGKRPFGRSRRRWVDTIKMDLQKVIWRGIDLIDLAQTSDGWRTLANAVMNIRVPLNAGNFLTSFKPVSFSRRDLLYRVINK